MRPLAEYTRKRNFKITSEPGAKLGKRKSRNLSFVVQEHHASHLHYDFRLEWEGVLKSWAVPKGPSLDPGERRLAVEVEDHPIDYASFEGTIPEDQYGGGEVFQWDSGTWKPLNDVEEGLRKGRLEFEMHGKKLKGEFLLVRTNRESSKPQWLLIKRHDDYAEEGYELKPIAAYGNRRDKKRLTVSPKVRAKAKAKVWNSNRAEKTTKTAAKPAAGKKKAVADPFPGFISPQLAQLVSKPPQGDDWVHEIKFDGYRIQAHIKNGKVSLFSRRGLVWTDKYKVLASALAEMDVDSAVFDGEVVYQDEQGRSDFQKLQGAMKAGTTHELVYWLFDCMYLNGEDLRQKPLSERKARMKEVIEALGHDQIRYSEDFRGVGDKMIEASCSMNLEGIISKRVDTAYVPGRHDDWQKIKCVKRQEFVIGGFTDPEGSRVAFGALLLGVYEGRKLRFVGKCGTGFDQRTLREVSKKLKALEVDDSPFALASPRGRGLHWIKPQLVCEVSYAEMTRDGILRVPVFKGLRADKDPLQITIEKPKDVPEENVKTTRASAAKTKKSTKSTKKSTAAKSPAISSPERIIYAKEKLTKLDVAQYYQAVGKWMVPHVKDRPLSLVRCPNSSTKPCFFSKHFHQNLPEHLIAVPDAGHDDFLAVDSEEGLLTLVQWGTLEIHPWNCHRDNIDAPDQIVMDFDPADDVDFEVVKEGAVELREMLKQLGLRSWVKTTGGKGLHVQFPFEPLYDWDTVKNFAKTLVQEFVSRYPDLYTANMSKKMRKGKIFLDYLRNGRGATAVAPYSLRAKEISSVAMPIEWEELDKLKAANIFTLKKALEHLQRRKKDPWKDFFHVKQKIALLS